VWRDESWSTKILIILINVTWLVAGASLAPLLRDTDEPVSSTRVLAAGLWSRPRFLR
jgi:hypothetical protein